MKIPAVVLFLLLSALGAHAEGDARIALIIGNSTYKSLPKLPNPIEDARLMEKALKAVGFETVTIVDATRQRFIEGMKTLSSKIGPESSVVVFYAGHGIQYENENYLIPIDSELSDAASLPFEAFSLKLVTDQIARLQPKIAIFILDACRNNPLETNRSAGTAGATPNGATRGLARTTGPLGTYVAYATAPGQVATDGRGKNSPFTQALAQVITTPGLPVEQVFKRVRERVVEDTKGAQIPWDNSSLIRDFFFKTALAEEPQFSVEATQDAQAWQVASAADTQNAYATYRDAFPQGLFAEIAEARLKSQKDKEPSTEVATLPLPVDRTVDASSDLLTWNEIAGSSDPDRYRAYLEKHPNGLFAKLARLRLEDLSKDGINAVTSLNAKLSPQFAEFEETPLYPEITDCDRLAGHVQEIADPSVGVYFREIVPEKAIPACLEALKQFPDSLRILVNYARAIDAAGRHDEAREIYRMGAEKGFPIAMRSLGDVYRDGRGVDKNMDEARYWYVLGAAKSNVFAEFNLGLIFLQGLGVPENKEKAVFWFWRAARQGFAPAMQRLANFYITGEVVKKDEQQGRILLQGAAEMGNAPSKLRYGEVLMQGIGGEKDLKGGKQWIESAAWSGYGAAQVKLAGLYRDGIGGKPDAQQALNWLVVAEKGGVATAKAAVPSLAKKLGKAGLQKAGKFADSFVPRP
ncbi:caspase family protein (plasmid) [Rhizobium sp. 32-5/1]|uniref:caspase family protein n=1 Tax=Rhizobium sp. 32-5/1 TaxID=3019602 RepID=UPI00240D1A1D|nr:caspase family protein [Rhizobium sp. 32-5/1]WEZ85880.1 caspase family protein [Rhizobium sp. 32-5/1]